MASFSELVSNSRDDFMKTSELLIRFAENVLKDENNPKYRKIRLENKIFQEKILPFTGAVQCLFEMGFQEVLKASLVFKSNCISNLFQL